MVPSPHPTCGCPRGKSWNRRHRRSYVFHRHRCTRLCCYALQRCQRIQLSCFRTQRCRTGIEKWTTNQLKARHFDGKNLAFVELMLGFLMKCPVPWGFCKKRTEGSYDGSRSGSHGRSSFQQELWRISIHTKKGTRYHKPQTCSLSQDKRLFSSRLWWLFYYFKCFSICWKIMEDLNFSCHFQKLPNLTAFPLQTKTPPFSTPAMGSTSFSHIHLQIKSHSKHVIRRSRSKKNIGIRIRKCMSACGSHGRTLCVQATSCVCVCVCVAI